MTADDAVGVNVENVPREIPPALPAVGSVEARAAHFPRQLRLDAEAAGEFAKAARSPNTIRSYEAAWRAFETWRARSNLMDVEPDEPMLGLFLAALAREGVLPSTIDNRLAGVIVHLRERGFACDRRHPAIRDVLLGIRNRNGRPPRRKAAILTEELVRMLGVLPVGVRGLRDRAILLLGFAGGLRRSEIVGLDVGEGQSKDGSGWLSIEGEGIVLRFRSKTGWREVGVGRGAREATCPVEALEQWLRFGRISHGPVFRRIRVGDVVTSSRLTDQAVWRLVRETARAAGLRPALSEGEREFAFGGHSLRAGMATSADVDEATVQKQLGHHSVEMTRTYKRDRDRFRVNVTKALGL